MKNLFMLNFTEPKTKDDLEAAEWTESFKETDIELSPYINVHVLDIPISEAKKKGIGIYGRDLITEWGNILFVRPGLMEKIPE